MQKDSVLAWPRPPVHLLSGWIVSLMFIASSFGSFESEIEGFERQTEGLGIPAAGPAAAVNGDPIPQNWTATADSYQVGNEPYKAFDGDSNTFWDTEWSPVSESLPQNFTIDLQGYYNVTGLTYQPRQDGSLNGNIGQHEIFVSKDNETWDLVCFGTFYDDDTNKSASWETRPAQYVRIRALSEAGNRGPWASAAEIQIYNDAYYQPPPNGIGKWGLTINFPLVPGAVSLERDTGNLLTWASYTYDLFTGTTNGQTFTSIYSPSNQSVSELVVTNTDHDMFCPGISMDFNGRTVVTGGNSAPRTSIYDPDSSQWISGPNMNIPRGYQASCTLSDGRIFTIGGSWSGGDGGKNGEIYDPNSNTWTLLPGCPVQPMLTNDIAGLWRRDNHGWLFGWKEGWLLQAGPSSAMNWYGTTGSGAQVSAGNRADDSDSMCGNAVMYDATGGKILAVGGSPNYQGTAASSGAHIITIAEPPEQPNVETVANMTYPRIFSSAVVLPDGKVLVVGGQTIGEAFTDNNAILTPEMWDPAIQTFMPMAPHKTPRTYHSWCSLVLDGTVVCGGGGLCGDCTGNHFDAQVYWPQYLLNSDGSEAPRPIINSMTTNKVPVGGSFTFVTDSPIESASFIRFSSATHTVNTDQRRMTASLASTGVNGVNSYGVNIPSDPGIALPGFWMFFAMNNNGVPALAQTVQITL